MDVDWRTTAHLATFRFANGVFEIVPLSLSRSSLFAMNLACVACLSISAIVFFPQFKLESPWAFAFAAGATLVACGATTGATTWSHLRERRKGTWFIYDSNQEVIRLPRHQVEFPRADLLHVEEVITRSVRNPTCHLISELNVVAVTGSGRQRWNLLRSDAADGAFGHLLIPMRRYAGLPIVRIRGNISDWTVRTIHFHPVPTN